MVQFIKFSVVGVLNTLVDLGIFNILIFIFGLTEGPLFLLFKGISFIAAVTNSYFMNKHLVFNRKEIPNTYAEKNKTGKEVGLFFLVSLLGLLLNITVSYAVFAMGKFLVPDTASFIFANLGAIAGSGAVLIWNFLGYKFLVFKK